MNWKEIAFIFAFLFVWIALNRWILPAFGISTCMSGSCGQNRQSQTSCCPLSSAKQPAETTVEKITQEKPEAAMPQDVNAAKK